MKVLVSSDETGTVKEVVCARGTDTSQKDGIKPASIRKVCLEPQPSSKTRVKHMVIHDEKYLVTVRLDGTVCIYDMSEDYEVVRSFDLGHKNPVALVDYYKFDVVLVAFEDGALFIINLEAEPIEIKLPTEKNVAAFTESLDVDGIFGLGGEENDVKIVKISTFTEKSDPEIVFEAENVENDFLDMRVPISITGMRFLQSEEDAYRFITVTKYGQLRIYDTKESKSPISDFKLSQKAFLALELADEDETTVVLTDKANLVAKYSLSEVDKNAVKINSASAGELRRGAAKLLGKFSEGGNTGAVHALHNYENVLLATGGLDRYLRVFDINTRRLIAKVYVGTQISSAIILEDDEAEQAKEPVELIKKRRNVEPSKEDDDEADELWEQLESNKPKPTNKKSRKS